jgi:N-acetylglucosamine-6-phosphate deacetylase
MCATGRLPSPHKGTREPGSDEYVLVSDDMYVEVIADSLGAHVRPGNIKLIYKLKGYAGIIIITDCCTGGDTRGSDVNIINGQLYGSRLTMATACRNMKKYTGARVWEIFKMASENPARAIGVFEKYGSLEVGKMADIVLINQDFEVQEVILAGELMDLSKS